MEWEMEMLKRRIRDFAALLPPSTKIPSKQR
ncbi:hypothetical protein AT2G07626 [Arabidopsis thaliana]|uniref:Uncharacterized protein n=2 Tax=Arabidopsis thaliana TaxID=3702 RepID=A0A5S9YK13_ARATH|nr:uncharacterized protein AT2G07626 [Arabidopsis thaliana]ANM61967.1 hypothetical protein AT2G07626 [Arabidopsis thaliana]CAA0413908.1 unnamed protein product [Arabidopsis thaliana]|eukprot:NP_001324153.1 hypothetical protein AT2G07626 [Arabidopsis thaliana]